MGCLWLQCSLGRPLATLTCAVKRCQPWFAIVHLWSPRFGADGLKKPHSGALDYHLFKDHCCPWLPDIHFTYIRSSDVRSSMTLGLFLSVSFCWLLLCAHPQVRGGFWVPAENCGRLVEQRLLSGTSDRWHSFSWNCPIFPKGRFWSRCKWVYMRRVFVSLFLEWDELLRGFKPVVSFVSGCSVKQI